MEEFFPQLFKEHSHNHGAANHDLHQHEYNLKKGNQKYVMLIMFLIEFGFIFSKEEYLKMT